MWARCRHRLYCLTLLTHTYVSLFPLPAWTHKFVHIKSSIGFVASVSAWSHCAETASIFCQTSHGVQGLSNTQSPSISGRMGAKGQCILVPITPVVTWMSLRWLDGSLKCVSIAGVSTRMFLDPPSSIPCWWPGFPLGCHPQSGPPQNR